jgi:glycosyltransferase involved in cell wall biosynthesis
MYYLFSAGGAHKANRGLLEGLAAKGHTCRVVVPQNSSESQRTRAQFLEELAAKGIPLVSSGPHVDVCVHNGVEVHAVTESSHLRAHLIAQIREFNPTWVLVSEDQVYGYALLDAALEACPGRVVYISHSSATLPFGPASFLTSPAKAEQFARTAGVITVSEYVRGYLRRWGGVDSRVIRFPVYGAGPFLRRPADAPGRVTMINPSAIKGLPIFLELARRLPHIPFAAVPTWSGDEKIRRMLTELPNVEIIPPSENIDDIYEQTRVLLVPSLWAEAFGQVVVEAMLRGIPVLASDSGGLPEAKLGVDYVLPVRQITSYEPRPGEKLMPTAMVPEQEVGPWERALREVWEDAGRYERLAEESWRAAREFVGGLSIDPFEDYLRELRPSEQGYMSTAGAESHGQKEHKAMRAKVDQLSPRRRALLVQMLKTRAVGDDNKPPVMDT